MKTCFACALGTFAAVLLLTGCGTTGQPKGHTTPVFNGKDLTGWEAVLADPAVSRDAVWSVRNGIIVCKGEPLGALQTTLTCTNFHLTLEYRWAPGSKPGNSGIFSRINGPARALPRCVEVQLQHGNAGDIMGLQGMMVDMRQDRSFEIKAHAVAGDIRGVKKLRNAEKPAGEWNHVEILAQEGTYTVWLNHQQVNRATGVEITSGPIGLQSEGGEIHFRRVNLVDKPR